jgi:allantoicase
MNGDVPGGGDFLELPDLAVRPLGGAVVWANDESFAQRENLLTPGPARFDPELFGPKGKVYDGWETRRRREPGYDEAIVRLGAPGLVRGVVVDTAWFTGNYPPEVSVEGLSAAGYPSAAELRAADDWFPLVPTASVKGDTANEFAVDPGQLGVRRRCTHVRLRIYPDGGVARLRVHGLALPDPGELDALGVFDLAALERGGLVLNCSNRFYSTPNNLLMPGPARSMAEGWETARRRDDGHDWVQLRLAGEGLIRMAELDTSYFLFNAPGSVSLRGRRGPDDPWVELLGRTPVTPDTRHRFLLGAGAAHGGTPVSEVRLEVYPDGGMARLRLLGALTDSGRAVLARRWAAAQP